MVSPATCKLQALANIEEYCTKNIEPLLLKSNNQPIYFGMYNEDGTKMYSLCKTYAKDPPRLDYPKTVSVHPNDIKRYLEILGYKVSWIRIDKYYPEGYSSTGRTRYYKAGCNTYFSLKISY